jgi:hypothetical protein
MTSAEDVNPAGTWVPVTYPPTPVERAEHAESTLTRMIEHQTARIPSDFFLFAALASMCASAALEITGRQRASRFIGMWVSPLLTLGVYNKMVKTFGPR